MRGLWLSLILSTVIFTAKSEGFCGELPIQSPAPTSFSYETTLNRLNHLDLHHIEGIWQFTSDGVTVVIERKQTNKHSIVKGYTIKVVESPNRIIRPGTLMGHIEPTASQKSYEARMYTNNMGSTLVMSKKFTLTLDDDDSRLVFNQHKSSISVNLWRFIPYMWRYSLRSNNKPKSSHGCIRIYPEPELPLQPVYL